MKQQILDDIRRLAIESDGVAPGRQSFESATGIKASAWRGKYWARWGDALAEAGFQPNQLTAN
jgi:hypothetical protein